MVYARFILPITHFSTRHASTFDWTVAATDDGILVADSFGA
jgi:hypothetical protein